MPVDLITKQDREGLRHPVLPEGSNGLGPLLNFLQAAEGDPRLGTPHLSLYLALFRLWVEQGNPFSVPRKVVMRGAKIGGVATYHRCLRELHAYGYIHYRPSYHPAGRTKVYLCN